MASDDFGEPFDGGGGRDFGGEGGLQEDADPILGDPTGDRRDSDNSSDRDRDTSGSSGSGSGSGGGGGGGSSTSPTRTVSGSTTVGANFPAPGSAPTADAPALDRADRATQEIITAERNPEIVDRGTSGGFLSERGGDTGLLPANATANTPRGELGTDISETRARELAATGALFRERLDVGATFSSPADPLGSGGQPRAGRPVGAPDPEGENLAENFVEGGAGLGPDLLAAPLATERVAEAGQAVPGAIRDFGVGETGETAVAVGRDRAAETADRARSNPGEFAGGVAGGLALGAGVLGRGATGGLRDAVAAELDPRVGPLGTTAETRAARGVRDFLSDDRGQAQLVGRSRGRDPEGETSETGQDDDLGPDLDPFDRSDARVFDPSRDFDDDVGGMADPDAPVDPSDADSRQDIGAGIGGRGEPGIVGSDAESFSSRGFGDVSGTELDPNPTDTFGDGVSPAGAGVGGVFGTVDGDGAATGADGLLGDPRGFDATGATPDVDGRADVRGGVDLDTGFTPGSDTDGGTDTGTDTDGGTDTDTRQDPRTDSGGRDLVRLDADTQLDPVDADPASADADLRDPEARDPRRRDPDPLDLDPPDRRDRDLPTEPERERRRREEEADDLFVVGETVTKDVQSVFEADDALVETLEDFNR
jgi:hypothetical protein